MKKISLVMVVCAAVVLVPTTSRAVELLPNCGYVYNGATATPPGFDASAQALLTALLIAGIGDLPASWTDADLETLVPGGDIVGDGIRDAYELGMLGAVLCSGEAAVMAQFNANKTLYNDLVVDINALLTAATSLATHATTAGNNVLTWAAGLPAGPQKDQAIAFGNALLAASTEITGFTGDFAALVTLLPSFSNLFAGLAGLSTEMQNTINGLLGDLTNSFADLAVELTAAASGCATFAPLVGPPSSAAEINALATELTSTAALLTAFTLPTFQIYAHAKTAAEDFSGFGDYNGDGATNLEVYDGILQFWGPNLSLARPEFVKWATGTETFAGVPVAGGLGLALLSGLVALGGAVSMRKK